MEIVKKIRARMFENDIILTRLYEFLLFKNISSRQIVNGVSQVNQ